MGQPDGAGGLGAEAVKADRHRYYRVSDRLVHNRDTIEEHLRQRQGELFGLDRTVLLCKSERRGPRNRPFTRGPKDVLSRPSKRSGAGSRRVD